MFSYLSSIATGFLLLLFIVLHYVLSAADLVAIARYASH